MNYCSRRYLNPLVVVSPNTKLQRQQQRSRNPSYCFLRTLTATTDTTTSSEKDRVTDREMATTIDSPAIQTFRDWWNGSIHGNERKRAPKVEDAVHRKLLDVRSSPADGEAQMKHLASCPPLLTVVWIPFEDLKERSFELAARHVSFAILLDSMQSPQIIKRVQSFFFDAKPNRRQRPWRATALIDASHSDNWQQATELGLTVSTTPSWTTTAPLPRLWQPDTLVQEVLLPLLQQRLRQKDSPANENTPVPEIWDLGAGAGRDACFLAEELKHSVRNSRQPFCVVALDQRYRDSGNNFTPALFLRRRVASLTRCQQIDLQNVSEVLSKLREEQNNVICLYAVRYWNRSLVEEIAGTDALANGTIFGISQFGKSHVGAGWNHAHPKAKHVLERNELREIFSDKNNDWTILHDQVVLDGDHGRTLIQFVAQKGTSSALT